LRIASDNALAQKQGKCGRARVEKDYTWDDTVRKTLMLYSETISDRILH
jgi:glycosyltransferase involved in cell wall biosynthesis